MEKGKKADRTGLSIFLGLVIIALAAAVCLLAYQSSIKTISGQVQVSSRTDRNVKLKGVKVFLYPAALLEKFVGDKRQAEERIRHQLEERLAEVKREHTRPLRADEGLMGLGTAGMSVIFQAASSKQDVESAEHRLKSWPTAGFYFQGLPVEQCAAQTVTDQQGRFSLQAQQAERYVLVACSDFLTEEPPDYYPAYCFWMVRVPPDKNARLVLDNENLTASGSADSLVKASCYKWTVK